MVKSGRGEWAAVFEARIFLYSMLKHVFYAEPNKELVDVVSNKEFIEDVPFTDENQLMAQGMEDIYLYFDEDFGHDGAFKDLCWDYTRMFVGPASLPAPPWESAYLTEDRLLFQESTLDVRRAYLKYNFIVKNYLREPDDHIGSELDFMCRLCQLYIDNIDECSIAVQIINDQKAFMEEHFARWVFDFADDVIKYSQTRFYRGMGKVLRGFIQLDREIVSELFDSLG